MDFLEGPNFKKDPSELMGNVLSAFQKFQESGKLEEILKKFQDGEYKDLTKT